MAIETWRQNETPGLEPEEAKLAPFIWGELYAMTGSTDLDEILKSANNLTLAIKYPESEWISPELADRARLMCKEMSAHLSYIRSDANDYIGDLVYRVAVYYRRHPRFFSPEES